MSATSNPVCSKTTSGHKIDQFSNIIHNEGISTRWDSFFFFLSFLVRILELWSKWTALDKNSERNRSGYGLVGDIIPFLPVGAAAAEV